MELARTVVCGVRVPAGSDWVPATVVWVEEVADGDAAGVPVDDGVCVPAAAVRVAAFGVVGV